MNTRIIHSFLFLLGVQVAVCAGPPKILDENNLPADRRLEPLKDLDGYFPFEPPASKREWRIRAADLRRQVLVSLGLWPMPEKTALNPVVHGAIDRGDYTVERAYFESFPGFYVTGNLYRPKGKAGKRPGVLCPHGHWRSGRFYDTGEAAARGQVNSGAEKLVESARSPLQARCVHLARMGCVVFHYDMIGYADSTQISYELAHRFAKQRPEANKPMGWGLFSPQAESHLQSVMGLQTYNSIRALDFLTSLMDVDPKRLAVTGASGGGTQTFVLCAVDSRPAVAMPAVMVSTAMQGGCTCENCCLLRVGRGNVDFAALFAPKPLALTAADDWTKEMETKGFPELKQHYEMLGAADNVMLHSRIEFGHNYNLPSRAAMYGWFNRHLKLEADVEERAFERLTTEQMTVWNDEHPRPEGGAEFERGLLKYWHADSKKQLAELTPKDEASLRDYRMVVGNAIDVVVGRELPAAKDVEYHQSHKVEVGDYLEMGGLLRNRAHAEEVPIVFLYPKRWEGHVVIWIDPSGKAGLYGKDGKPKPSVARLISSGAAVVGVDLLYQGEFLAAGKASEKTRKVKNPREFAGYTFGFNDTLFARRVHDILSAVTFIRNHEYTPKQVSVVGLGGAGPWVAAARAQARDAIDRAAIDTGGFRFGNVTDIYSPGFLPGGAKYGDLPGMLSLSAPDRLWLAGEGESAPHLVRAAYKAADAEGNLTVFAGKSDDGESAVQWLLTQE